MRPLTFVVGTGRTGSTMVSRILADHPDVLSLSEFYSNITVPAFPTGPMPGPRFWAMLTAPNRVLDEVFRVGLRIPEQVYPYGSGRFRPGHDFPALCHSTLPLLTSDPDGLHDELSAVVPSWPTRAVADHYRALFSFLAGRLGRAVVVERSGYSLHRVTALHAAFPEARFVHLHRSGADCAVSMSRHTVFRILALLSEAAKALGLASYDDLTRKHAADLPPELADLVLLRYDPAFLAGVPIPLETFGRQWSSLVVDGVAALSAIPAERRMDLRYEDLLLSPLPQLRSLAEFVGARPDTAWLDRAARRVDASRSGAAAELPAEELAGLLVACAPGELALAGSSGES